jgi:hypothetical protein
MTAISVAVVFRWRVAVGEMFDGVVRSPSRCMHAMTARSRHLSGVSGSQAPLIAATCGGDNGRGSPTSQRDGTGGTAVVRSTPTTPLACRNRNSCRSEITVI